MLIYKLQIMGLSKVRRNGFGELRTPRGLTFLYSGKQDEEYCYAPTNLASEEDKEDFYRALKLTLKKIRQQNIVIVMEDLNAKVDTKNNGRQRHMGIHGMGVGNENGAKFLEFCQDNDLTIGGTSFIHGDHHKYTWNSPDGVMKNQIDHLAISSKWRSSLLDVRKRRGANINCDHHLLSRRRGAT
ncbi:hypothetical protein MSG28_000092 [Choristoneura fumiferana]|uniref:Uncharacterized protein n=1 Tax=Choristoneura fumiferana TaxID=7141 RepID=A0ACC0JZ98_CHOFU|nr:hypothetical protein MSG28_000092 [Choristoneura fumiferana]